MNIFDLPTSQGLSSSNWGYCCVNCSVCLFTSGNIIKHNYDTKYVPILVS